MKREALLILLFLLSLSLASAAIIPEDCEDNEIEATWNSIFKENSEGASIFTNDTLSDEKCQEYFAYEIKGNETWFIMGETESENKTKITAIKLNATQEFIDMLNGFANIDDTRTLKDEKIINYSQVRIQNFIRNDLDTEFELIYKETPKGWVVDEDITSPIENDTVYYFKREEINNEYNITKTGHIANKSDYTSLNFIYTTPENCTANFTCGEWSNCTDGNMTRFCVDNNACEPNKVQTAECGCVPNWSCSDWTECVSNMQIRNCVDTNLCQNDSGKPPENQTCGETCIPNWQCTDYHPEKCDKSKMQSRNCTDLNSCDSLIGKPDEVKSCTYIPNFAWMIFFIILIIIILVVGVSGILKKRLKKKVEDSQGFPAQTMPPSKPPPSFPPRRPPSILTKKPPIPARPQPRPTTPQRAPQPPPTKPQPKPIQRPSPPFQPKQASDKPPTKEELEQVYGGEAKSKFLEKNP
jgi:hypothetical protein